MASVEELQEELVRQSTRRLEAEHERSQLEESWRAVNKELNSSRQRINALESDKAVLAQQNEEYTQREQEMQERLESMELELAELSSSLLEQANQKVGDANRRAAATLKLVTERDMLIESQGAQLQALKEMLNEVGEASSKRDSESRLVKGAFGTHGGARGTPSAPSTPNLGTTSTPGTPSDTANTRIVSGTTNGGGRSVSGASATLAAGAANADQLSRDLILDLDAYSSPLRPLMRTDIREFQEFQEVWGVEKNSHPSRFGKLESAPWRRPRFVQRAIQEDIEATLRLDRSPHMSWLQSRAFMSGVLDQTLTLEPCSQKEYPWRLRPSHPCLLCGENRSAEKYARSYWAITYTGAEPIVLDLACVAKAQLSCEFVSFLKYIADMQPSDLKTQKKAWSQCIMLREQLFWARTGALFPELSDEIWEMLNYDKYNDFDFETVDAQQNIDSSPSTSPRSKSMTPSTANTTATTTTTTATTSSATIPNFSKPTTSSVPDSGTKAPSLEDTESADKSTSTLSKDIKGMNMEPEDGTNSMPSSTRASVEDVSAEQPARESSVLSQSGGERFGTPDEQQPEKTPAMPGQWPG